MRDTWGHRCYSFTRTPRVQRRWLTVPQVRDYKIRILFHDHWRIYSYTPRRGWLWVSWGRGGRNAVTTEEMSYKWRWLMAVRRRTPPSDKTPPPALPVPFDVLGDGSLLAEHITATKYDDGAIRTPGSFTVRNRGTHFEITVYDHDAGLRTAVNGPTLQDAIDAAEVMLGTPDAPWEVDQYLTSLNEKRGKKKK